MRNVNATIIYDFLNFTIAKVITKIVAHGYNNHILLKLFSFKMIHRHSSCYLFLLFYLIRSEEHTSELQSRFDLVCRLLLEKKKKHSCSVSWACIFTT